MILCVVLDVNKPNLLSLIFEEMVCKLRHLAPSILRIDLMVSTFRIVNDRVLQRERVVSIHSLAMSTEQVSTLEALGESQS